MTPVRIFVPQDAAAASVGADAVARALAHEAAARGLAFDIVRTGARGMMWLEPLVEVETHGGRIAYGPVGAGDVAGLVDAGFHAGGAHRLRLGAIEDLDWMKRQSRLVFARCGVQHPLSLDDWRARGGLAGLKRALEMGPEAIVDAIQASGLRGRGGAGFPAGVKWATVRDAEADRKYVVCNADEGDSGTFADRMLMEGDPFQIVEGMIVAGLAVGATKGFVYVRSEYPRAFRAMTQAIARAQQAGLLGDDVLGSRRAFRIEVRLGAGAYICGEEMALIESLEGKRGMVRAKPPLPAVSGLFGRPTLVHNVLTLAAVPFILAHGADAYAAYGVGRSRGTMPIQLAGNVKRGGLIEAGFGLSLREIVEDFGGGTLSGRPVRAVQLGGPLGAYLPETALDVKFDYESLSAVGGMLGHGGIVVFDDSVDMARQARFAFAFCARESCGKCTPCRIGAVRGLETMDRIIAGENVEANIALVRDLGALMSEASLCAMGGLTPAPVLSALRHFGVDFRARRTREAGS